MPSENKTPNYGLNQWSGNEYVKRQDFVDDNLSIDTNLKRIEGKIDNIEVPVISVNSKTGAVVLNAADVGAETPAEAQNKANTAEGNAKTHTNTLIGALSSLTTTIKTSIVNAINSLKGEVDAHKADDARHFTTADRTKFAGIQAGAQVNAVASVAGRTGAVTLVKGDVGLGSVENYPIATQAQAQAGSVNTVYMTPLRVKEAIATSNGVMNLIQETTISSDTSSIILTIPSDIKYLKIIIENLKSTSNPRNLLITVNSITNYSYREESLTPIRDVANIRVSNAIYTSTAIDSLGGALSIDVDNVHNVKSSYFLIRGICSDSHYIGPITGKPSTTSSSRISNIKLEIDDASLKIASGAIIRIWGGK